MTHLLSTALIGVGHVGRNFLHLLETKAERLRSDYDIGFRIVLVADSSGVAIDHAGFDPGELRRFKAGGGRVCELPGFAPGRSPAQAVTLLDACDLLLDASPVNLSDGEPGLSAVRAALRRGSNVVLANKAPLVLAYRELFQLAQAQRTQLSFSATVCGALPVINIGQRDLVAADITLLRGIFNSTSNFVLEQMAQGRSYADALAEAQQRGIAEADPSLDVEGWDTANKLVIIANSVLGVETTLADVSVEGITRIDGDELRAAQEGGQTIKLVASAEATKDGYRLSVGPARLAFDDFLASCNGWEMGVEIHSDLYGKMYHKIWEREPLPTAAAMLRDAVNQVAGLPGKTSLS